MPTLNFRDPRHWLARLGFAFLVIGGALAYEAYRANRLDAETTVPQWRVVLYLVGAVACFLLGVAGIRERHRLLRESGIDRDPRPGDRDGLR